ncbi:MULTISPECIES: hypothetical protein [unclassified Actinobaculum]|uniref:hypothetical protein n=1 Tax=unclassified Actinobaculum TaxID=2609299 RepID=UPI000D528D16|nr:MULTISPECIES: hypothetical protein [unclassified Actinobaculum]AWE43087.1 hypothetical protein DDD63_10445 [Actinobaculum sp. 313]RTE48527.1 hypothetical protein EKN07_09170 [Actinobaculum sp. 352]
MKKRRFYTTRAFFAVIAIAYIGWLLLDNPSFQDPRTRTKIACAAIAAPIYETRTGGLATPDDEAYAARSEYLDSPLRYYPNDIDIAWAQGCEVARMSRQTHIILASLLATIIFFSIPPRQKGNTGNRDQGETVDSEQPSQDT